MGAANRSLLLVPVDARGGGRRLRGRGLEDSRDSYRGGPLMCAALCSPRAVDKGEAADAVGAEQMPRTRVHALMSYDGAGGKRRGGRGGRGVVWCGG